MGSAKNSKQLDQLIISKEAELLSDNGKMKLSLKGVQNSLKPLNLIQVIFSNIKSSPNLKDEAVKSVIGFVRNYVGKKIADKKQAKKVPIETEEIIDKIMQDHSDEIKMIRKLLLKQAMDKSNGVV